MYIIHNYTIILQEKQSMLGECVGYSRLAYSQFPTNNISILVFCVTILAIVTTHAYWIQWELL